MKITIGYQQLYIKNQIYSEEYKAIEIEYSIKTIDLFLFTKNFAEFPCR